MFFVQRNYDVSLPHNKIPDALCHLAKKMAASAMPMGEEFQPEAAIVNYFASGKGSFMKDEFRKGHETEFKKDFMGAYKRASLFIIPL
ncbi:hypothetical protein ACLOJK_008405 [Asimina triloba]